MNQLKNLLLVSLLFCSSLSGKKKVEVPFLLPQPEGWGAEAMSLPFGFAPEMRHTGIADLRFAPGMFRKGEDEWTYAFVWWVDGGTKISAELLQGDLAVYYQGIAEVVARGKKHEIKDAAYDVMLKKVSDESFEGRAKVFDSFVNMANIELNIRVKVITCPAGKKAILFTASPQAFSHIVWKSLGEIQDGFACQK